MTCLGPKILLEWELQSVTQTEVVPKQTEVVNLLTS